MRTIIFMMMLLMCGQQLMAQTWDEWFRQKKTKLKYIEQQIVAFQVYAGYLKKGYEIVDKGWNTINDIKHGDFDLHSNYFSSLQQVDGSITDYDKVDGITNLQSQILQVNDATKRFIENNENIQATEKSYIKNVLGKCANDLDQLKALTTKDSLSMKDDERLKHVDDLYDDMQDKYAFIKYFQSSVQTLALTRAKGTNDINTSKLLYGIKQ